MHAHEAADFWGLHKNMNSAFPLKSCKQLKISIFVSTKYTPI